MPFKKMVNITAQMPALMVILMEQDAVIMAVVVRAKDLSTPRIFQINNNEATGKYWKLP
jgi:hypothetical protein